MDDWVNAYGKQDLFTTVPQIINAIKAIETCQRVGPSKSKKITEIFHHCIDIGNSKFFATELGKYVQIAVLVGHEIDPEKYLKGSQAIWDGKSPIKLMDIALKEDPQGHHMIQAAVHYWGFNAGVVKNIAEMYELLY
jgi:hypothetical protein